VESPPVNIRLRNSVVATSVAERRAPLTRQSDYSEAEALDITIGLPSPSEVDTKNTSWKINEEKWKPRISGAWFKFGTEYEDVPYLYFTSRIELRTFIAQLLELDITWQCKEVELANKIEKERLDAEAKTKF
jgi:hypothetical protein